MLRSVEIGNLVIRCTKLNTSVWIMGKRSHKLRDRWPVSHDAIEVIDGATLMHGMLQGSEMAVSVDAKVDDCGR